MIKLSFQDITEECHILINDITNPVIQKLYSNFTFLYFPNKFHSQFDINNNGTLIYNFLLNFLKKYKLIAYKFTKIPDSINLLNINDNPNSISEKSQNENIKNQIDAIICMEKHCLIIEKIDISLIEKILNQTESSLINFNDESIFHEVKNFTSAIQQEIKKNYFIKFTIFPISGYLIRRFFYPSNYFKDQSFFRFDDYCDSKDECIQNELNNLLQKNESEENFQQNILSQINSTETNQSKPKIYQFKKEDFIFLKLIYSGRDTSEIQLAIHLESLYIFAIKIVYDPVSSNNHEIEFCKNYSNRNFMRFYGFLKNDKNQINGYVYEFMSNGNLDKFIKFKKDKINDFFSLLTLIRVFNGIKYLHSNNLIHRDLKPDNILLDHNLIPYISDFEYIRHIDNIQKDSNEKNKSFTFDFGTEIYSSPEQLSGKYTITFATDIFSFGAITYFLFEKKDMEKITENGPISKINHSFSNIKFIYESCVKYIPIERIKLESIEEIICKEIQSFSILEEYLINEQFNEVSNEINQCIFLYLKEIILFVINYTVLLNKIIKNIQIFIKLHNNQDKSSSLLDLGNYYLDGINFEQDYSKAIQYLDLSSILNNSEASFKLGNIYFEGKIVQKDLSKVKYYYKLSSQNNNSYALFNLGNLYIGQKGLGRNIQKAIKYLKMAADLDNPYSFLVLGIFYIIGMEVPKDISTTIKYYERASQKNLSMCSLSLGLSYLLGDHVSKNLEKADHYFELYIDQRNHESHTKYDDILLFNGYLRNHNTLQQVFINFIEFSSGEIDNFFMIASLYYTGRILRLNYLKAIKYLEFSAELNNVDAYRKLIYIYSNGIGVKQDYAKAIHLLEFLAEQNDADSLYDLGILYFDGIRVEKNYIKAREYFEKCSKLNNSCAIHVLGVFYFYGLGVEVDYIRAREYFELGAYFNDSNSLHALGNIYILGLGVKKDYEKARNCFLLSAKQKNINAIFNLGQIYENGFGVKIDYQRAIHYYEISASYNYPMAFFRLGYFYLYGKGVKVNVLKL